MVKPFFPLNALSGRTPESLSNRSLAASCQTSSLVGCAIMSSRTAMSISVRSSATER